MHRYRIINGAQSLAADTAKTVCQVVTGATRKCRHVGFKLSFASISASDEPVLVEILEQTGAGAGSAAATLRAVNRSDPAAITTALTGFTTEPTDGGVVLDVFRVTPVGGTLVLHIPEDDQIEQSVSMRIGYRLTADQNQVGVHFTPIIQE